MKPLFKPTNDKADAAEVFAGLVGSNDNCFLLETLADENQPQTSGQSYIGVAPQRVYSSHNNSYEDLRAALKIRVGLPAHYIGGLVGYMSHEAMGYFEPSLEFPYKREFPDFEFGEYRDGLIFKAGQPTQYFHYGEDRNELYRGKSPGLPSLKIEYKRTAKTKPEYLKMVASAKDDIQNGRVFQVVLANKYEYSFSGELFELYKELRRINPSVFMFFIKFGDRITMGASPELLLHATPGRKVYLEALAGTIERGKTATQDRALAAQLLNDEKENAEHNMLVDLYRNDLGRVCETGTVKIDRLRYIKPLSHVQHICSLVSGQLKSDKDAFDALAAAFPAGTLVGAPKIEAAKMLVELEGYERGPFGGSIGYFSYNGDAVHAVNIRSVNASSSKLLVHAGGGIVYDSSPEREYQEVNNKKMARDLAVKRFMDGDS